MIKKRPAQTRSREPKHRRDDEHGREPAARQNNRLAQHGAAHAIDRLTVPLLVDHQPSISSQAGAVTSLEVTPAGLQATASLADTDAGRQVWKLAQANALGNSFSVTINPYQPMGSDKVVRDAELPEISVVFEGVDASAVFKSIGGGEKLNPEETNRPGWKDTKEGMTAFGTAILGNPNNPSGMREQWKNELQRHHYDVTGIENLIPAPITDAFDKGGCGLYPLLHKMSMESWELTENMVDPSAAAENYPGSNGSRKVKSELLAEYVEVAHGDILRLANTPADLIQYVSEELPNRLVNTIEKGVLFPVTDGNGTAAAFHDVFTDATGTPDSMAAWLAGSMQAAAETPTVADLIKLRAMVKANGARVLITSRQTLATIKRSIAGNGNFIGLGSGAVAEIVGVDKIITPSWWTPAANLGALAIIMVPSHYLLVGGDVNSYAQFWLDNNTDKNTDKFWSELLVGGSLDSAHAAAVLTPKA